VSLKIRILAAAAALALNQQQMAALLKITPEWLSKIARGHVAGSEDIGLRLDAALRSQGIEPTSILGLAPSHILAEDPAPYGRLPPVNLRPEFSPPAPLPTRQDCVAHVTAYLDAAAQVPGGYAIALHKIKRALPLDEFAPAGVRAES